MHRPGKPSAYLVASTKLQHEWSANRCVPHINSEWLDQLLNDSSFGQMNSMVKIRLLLAGLLALDKAPETATPGARQQQAAARAELQSVLQRLRDVVATDADEWDKVMAAAAGPMDGRLDLEAVMQRSPAVQESMTNLKQLVAASTNQHLLSPQEDDFLRDPPSVLDQESTHFAVRANPRVQPLSAGFNYTQATPPPPSLLRAQAAHAGAAQAAGASTAAAQRWAQARSQGTAGASGMSRAKSGQLDKQHSVQVLDDQGQAADLFKNTHQKYGVAAGVQHEQLAIQKPKQQQAQQHLRRQQQQRYLQQQQEQRPKGTFFNIYGTKSAAEAAPTPPPAAAAAVQDRPKQRQRQRDADIDDLFDDEGFIDDREVEHYVAPTGASRIVRHLTHNRSGGRGEEEEHEQTPDELFDDLDEDNAMQVDEGGGGGGKGGVSGDGVEGEGVQEGTEGYVEGEEIIGAGVGSGVGGGVEEAREQQASAAKRRRMHVIASESEDDD